MMYAGIERDARGCEEQPPAPYEMAALRGLDDGELRRLLDRVRIVRDERALANIPVRIAGRSMPTVMLSIIRIAASDADITPEELLTMANKWKYAHPRQRAMASIAALKKADGKPRFSQAGIARVFQVDRATLHHAIKSPRGRDLIRVEQ